MKILPLKKGSGMTWCLERLLEKAYLINFKIVDIYDVREEIKIHKRID